MSYVAPLKDMLFVMNELAALNAISQMPGCEDATPDTAEAVLEENAKFCAEVLAPLNWAGDLQPSMWRDGVVNTTPGFTRRFAVLLKPVGRACSILRHLVVKGYPNCWVRRVRK